MRRHCLCRRLLSAGCACFLESLGSLIGQLFTLIEGAYQRAPILLLALSALLILPAVALISARDAVRYAAPQSGDGLAGGRAQAGS